MTIQKEVRATAVFRWLKNSTARLNILRGGTRSSKTYSLIQHIILNKLIPYNNRVIIVVMKTLPALKKVVLKPFLELMDEYIGFENYSFNQTDKELKYKNSIIYFMSLDKPNKAAGLDYNDLWMEEATDFTHEDFRQFNMRSSHKGDGNQLYLSFNPVDALHWIKTELVDKNTLGLVEHVSTYRDNLRNLSPEIIGQIKDLINRDENFYKVYNLGEWGILKNIIYSGWKSYSSIGQYTQEVNKEPKNITYGIDWGFSQEAALVKTYWFDGYRFISEELIHQSGFTIPDFISEAKTILADNIDEKDPNKKRLLLRREMQREFFAGTDEPGSIQEFYNAGFNIHRAATDVRDGINFCKSHLIGLIGSKIIKEAQGYRYKEDKDENVLDEPVKAFDHAMDAMRYSVYTAVKGQSEVMNLNLSLR